jgi:hypothetical protein
MQPSLHPRLGLRPSSFYSLFFLLNFQSSEKFFNCHHSFYVPSVEKTHASYFLNPQFFFARWKQGVQLLTNVFFLTSNYIMFGTEFFKKETLAFGWFNNYHNVDLWKFVSPYLIFKTPTINHTTNSFFFKLKKFCIDCTLIYDSYYHFKTLYYLNKYNFFTVGLSHSRMNPWIFSYSFFALTDSILTQTAFFYIVNFSLQSAFKAKFVMYKKSWYSVCSSFSSIPLLH